MPSFFQYQLEVFAIPLTWMNLDWGHLWFIAYLLVYSIIALPLFLYFRTKTGEKITEKLIQLLQLNPFIILLLVIPTIGLDLTSELLFNGRINRGSVFFIYFIYGYIFFSLEQFSKILEEKRKIMLFSAIATAFLYLFLKTQIAEINSISILFITILKHLNSLLWIYVVVGYARIYLNFQHSSLHYANEAVYPFYILHQSIIVVLGFYFIKLESNIFIKFSLISIGTFLITLIMYEYLIRKNNLLRLFFGLKPLQRKQ